MRVQTSPKLAHLLFYAHAAAIVAFAFAGVLPRDWFLALCLTFPATGMMLHGYRKAYKETTGGEANWLGA
jgi:hypothetical protein